MHGRRRDWWAASLGLALTVAVNCAASADVERLSLERKIGPYAIRIYDVLATNRDPAPLQQILRIARDEKILATVEDYRVTLEPHLPNPPRGHKPPSIGANVIGGSEPNVLVYRHTGGARCCHEVDVFELGSEVRKLDSLYGGDAPVLFYDVDGDGVIEATLRDGIFAYWRADFAESPLVTVRLTFDRQSQRYRLAAALMRKLGPSPADVPKRAERLRVDSGWSMDGRARVAPALWAAMLDYVYSGQIPAARQLMDLSWPSGLDGKAAFYDELMKCQLRYSAFWSDIADLNGLPDDDPEGNCPGPQ